MNSLERYIGDLSPAVWINADHVNGFNVPQPADGATVNPVVNLGSSGTGANGIIGGGFLTAPIFKSSGGLNNNSYLDLDMTAGINRGFFIPELSFPTSNNKFSVLIVASDIITIDNNNNGIVARDAGLNFGTISIGAVSTGSIYSAINGQTALGNVETNFVGGIRYINSDRHKRSFLSDIRTFDGALGAKIIAADNTYYVESVNASNAPTISTNNYPITFGFRGRSDIGNVNSVSSAVSRAKNRLYEFCYWNRTLSQREVRLIQTYIKLKYNI